MAYMKMTPAQRMDADILARMHLTEQQIAQMDPKKREAEKRIADMVKKEMLGVDAPKAGLTVAVLARSPT